MKILCTAICLVTTFLFAGIASAATVTGNLNVSANVVTHCTLSTSDVNFGNYTGSALDATGDVSVTCTNAQSYTIALSRGHSSDYNRFMTFNYELYYNLYKDASHATIWGDGTEGSETVSDTGSSSPQSHTVYGRIPGGQWPDTGAYSDSIVVTITY
ncbi:MAG: spore coat U domain-containing protein [bacterium]|nr:spore coat U domain-containing protein [bacterium]